MIHNKRGKKLIGKFDIITIGSAVVDVFVDTGVPRKGNMMKYKGGDKILIENLRFTTGGGGTNAGVCFSKMGLKTGFIGKVGNEHNSEVILKELNEEKVKFLGGIGEEHTGYSLVFGGKGKNRTIFTYRGINNDLVMKDVKSLNTKWFYFSSMMGKSFETQKKISLIAERKEIKVAYNPSCYQAEKGINYLMPVLKRTDVLILNKEEAGYLAGNGKNKLMFLRSKIKKNGMGIVCITDGKNGAECFDGTYKYKVITHNINVVDNTGAGDAFGSGFVAGLIRSKGNVEFALKVGLANSESVIQQHGAKNGLLSWGVASKKGGRIVRRKVI